MALNGKVLNGGVLDGADSKTIQQAVSAAVTSTVTAVKSVGKFLTTTASTSTASFVKLIGQIKTTSLTSTVSLIKNVYYPIRIMFGNLTGPGIMTVSYQSSTQAKTSDWTGKIFYNNATNGF